MRLNRRWKVAFAIITWITLVIAISLLPVPPFVAPIVATVISLLAPWISDKILDIIAGKEDKGTKSISEFAEKIAAEEHKFGEKTRRKEKLENHLKSHYEDELLPAMREWFKPPSLPIRWEGRPPWVYRVLSAWAYYRPHGSTLVSDLTEPIHLEANIVRDAVEHLSKCNRQQWKRWLTLKKAVNSHLRRIAEIWDSIEKNIENIAEELGLEEYKATSRNDFFALNPLVEQVWRDAEYYQLHKEHLWKDYTTQQDLDGWQFGGIWVKSQTREKSEDFKRRLIDESNRIMEDQINLQKQKEKLEHRGKAFQNSLKLIEEDYTRRHKSIPCCCSTCEEWLNELATLQ